MNEGLLLTLLIAGQGNSFQAAAAAPPAIRLQQVNGPWVKLSVEPALSSAVGPATQAAGARPPSLAAADLDADGTPEIVAGYVGDSGGLVVVYREGVAQTFALPIAPDFLYTGDFDARGGNDLIVAARGGDALRLLPGDRILEIRNSVAVTVTGVTVKDGNLTTSANGGGILVNSGTTLSLEGVSVQENQTASGSGGGIYSAGTLTLANSAVISNTTGGAMIDRGIATGTIREEIHTVYLPLVLRQ